jgi:hypothetical protein
MDFGPGSDLGIPRWGPLSSGCLGVNRCSEDPSPLLCCPGNKLRAGVQSSAWVLQLAKVLSHLVGVSCDGDEERLSALFENMVESNSEKGTASSVRTGKKGMRELNSLFSSINYDAHSGSTSRGRNKARDHRGLL